MSNKNASSNENSREDETPTIKINVYENEKSLSVLNQTEKKTRNKNAFKGMKATQKKHHSGPIKTQFIVDSLGRAKTKRVRKATLFKKAKELFSTTNLDVAVMVLDNKKIDSFFTPNGILENNIFKNLNKIMPNAIESSVVSATSSKIEDEDDDDDEEEEEGEEEEDEDENKKPNVETQVEYEDIDYDKTVCSICNIKIGSKLDRLPSPYLNYSIIKCQRGLCSYNVHNFCIGLGLENEKTLQKLKFLCPKHTRDV